MKQKKHGLPAKRAAAASAAVMPQGAAVCGDRGGQIKRGPRRACAAGLFHMKQKKHGLPAKRAAMFHVKHCPDFVLRDKAKPRGGRGAGVQGPHATSPTPCLPCVRGGAERMRSGGVVGTVQEKVTCSRQPVPIRHLQPLSQTLRVCQLPLHRGAKPSGGLGSLRGSQGAGLCPRAALVRGRQDLRGTEDGAQKNRPAAEAPRGQPKMRSKGHDGKRDKK